MPGTPVELRFCAKMEHFIGGGEGAVRPENALSTADIKKYSIKFFFEGIFMKAAYIGKIL